MGYTSGGNSKLRASVRLRVVPPYDDEDDDSESEDEEAGRGIFTIIPAEPVAVPTSGSSAGDEEGDGDEGADADSTESTDADPNTEDPTAVKGPPPLPHIFGVLAPPSLREAQASAIGAVGIIAQLAGVEVRMRGVEVEVRRARKRALKAEKGR